MIFLQLIFHIFCYHLFISYYCIYKIFFHPKVSYPISIFQICMPIQYHQCTLTVLHSDMVAYWPTYRYSLGILSLREHNLFFFTQFSNDLYYIRSLFFLYPFLLYFGTNTIWYWHLYLHSIFKKDRGTLPHYPHREIAPASFYVSIFSQFSVWQRLSF